MKTNQLPGDSETLAEPKKETLRAQHTPGPWQVIPDSLDIVSETGNGLAGRFIAEALESTLATDESPVYCTTDLEAKANARLIAAAPELLDALRAVIHDLENGTCSRWKGAGSASLRAAIAKAEGRAS